MCSRHGRTTKQRERRGRERIEAHSSAAASCPDYTYDDGTELEGRIEEEEKSGCGWHGRPSSSLPFSSSHFSWILGTPSSSSLLHPAYHFSSPKEPRRVDLTFTSGSPFPPLADDELPSIMAAGGRGGFHPSSPSLVGLCATSADVERKTDETRSRGRTI